MLILLNPFKSHLCVLSLIAFLLLLIPVLTANEPAIKPTNQEFITKTAKLQMPFIANNGQVNGQVKFYAKTFGGTVFVTKEGEIVYALPGRDEGQGAGVRDWESGVEEAGHGPRIAGSGIQSPSEMLDFFLISCSHSISKIISPNYDYSIQHPEFSNPNSEILGVALKEQFVGAKTITIQGEEKSVTKVNYFKGNDPSKWKTNISTYDSVNLGEIYDGIELKLRAYGNNVEKLFCVKPGAGPDSIKINVEGIKGLSVNEEGQLEAETELGTVKFTKPVAYQEIEGKRVEVDVEYSISNPKSAVQNDTTCHPECNEGSLVLKRDSSPSAQNDREKSAILRLSAHDEVRNQKFEYGFTVASYDRTKPLIIDPLLASTSLGGSNHDHGHSLTLDTSGNVYVTGYTDSTDFPTTSGAYDTSHNDSHDVFVSKLDSGLNSLLASTYLGGSNFDGGISLALDINGNVYVTGHTDSIDFPTTSGAYDTSHNDSHDVFVSKLNSGLTSLLASTYLGGSDHDEGYAIAFDTSGHVYVTGETDSRDFPTTSGAYDTSQNGSMDAFISKLNSGLTSLLASTYLGGYANAYGSAITLDISGNVYVTGYTDSTDFPTTSGAWNTSFNGGDFDVFISKLNGGLTSLPASTYLGGSDHDEGCAIALDTSGYVFVTGYTDSTDFPTTSGVYDTSFNGSDFDVFISKLDSNLSSSDTTAPTGSISINSGAEYTNTTSVTLNLSATDEWGVTGYYGSTNPFKPSASDSGWTEITTTTIYNEDVPYQLDGGDGSKSVYAWFKDIYDNVSSGERDSIVVDTTESIVAITSPTSDDTYTTTSSTISLSGIAMDATSGLSSITWSNDKVGSGGTANGMTNWSISNISLSVGNNTITVTATDNAGNSSADTIIVTYTPYTPTPTPTATATPTPTPIICDEATDIEAEPDLLILKVNKSNTVIVTVTGENGCQVEGDTVRASVSDSSLISVAPQMQVTDENGEARFKITANNKTGNVVVTFRDGSLSTKVTVKVVK